MADAPASGVATAVAAPARVLTAQSHLCERRVQILRRVEQDKANAGVASTLGYSESTAKQGLQRAIRTVQSTTDTH